LQDNVVEFKEFWAFSQKNTAVFEGFVYIFEISA
jgi:hypothetical protein